MNKKAIWRICISLSLIFGIGYFGWFSYQTFRKEFSVANIEYPKAFISSFYTIPSLEVTSTEKKLALEILNQPYHYLSQGRQVYAFESEDKKYVLKIFNFYYLRPYSQLLTSAQKKKLDQIVNGYTLAFKKYRQHTHLLYLRFTSSQNLGATIDLTDRFGFYYQVQLDETVFAIQLKGVVAREYIGKFLKEGDVESAKKSFRNLFSTYIRGYEEALFDRDYNLMHNSGFLAENPMRIDIGRFSHLEETKNTSFQKADLNKLLYKRVGPWLQRHFPKYRTVIVEDLEKFLQQTFSNDI
jgi:hypothetical protein